MTVGASENYALQGKGSRITNFDADQELRGFRRNRGCGKDGVRISKILDRANVTNPVQAIVLEMESIPGCCWFGSAEMASRPTSFRSPFHDCENNTTY
jgi:hypothetical protein